MDTTLYDPLDIYIGNWITNVPYYFEGNTYKGASRTYITNKDLDDLDCKGKRFFKTTLEASYKFENRPHRLHMNGRNYYYESGRRNSSVIKIRDPLKTVTPLCKEISLFNGINVNLASLICLNLVKERSWPEIFTLLQKCDMNSNCYECTPVGHKIAASLIRIASTRIFADPEQSILELPVNSIDSYFPESRVGKFGMGFFSFLYWLVDHPKRSVHIYTCYKEGENGYCSYHVILYHTKNGMQMSLKVLDSSVTMTGTTIRLDSSKDRFSENDVGLFHDQIYKLQYNDKISLFSFFPVYRSKDEKYTSVNHEQDIMGPPYDVFVKCNREEILVEDYAKGIPIHVLLGSLFVPSISTKKIQSQISIPEGWKPLVFVEKGNEIVGASYINGKGYHDTYFDIIVNGVVVLNLRAFHSDEILGQDRRKLVIEMPPNTQLPVSRDDIILNEGNVDLFIGLMMDGYELFIKKYNDVSYVDTMMGEYENYTKSEFNKNASRRVRNMIFEKYIDYFVSKKLFDVVFSLSNLFIISKNFDDRRAESTILRIVRENKDSYSEETFRGKTVIFVPGLASATNADMASIIFVPEKDRETKQWIDNTIMALPEKRLVPYSTPFGDERNREISEIIDMMVLPFQRNEEIYNMVATFLGLTNRYNISRTNQIAEFVNGFMVAEYKKGPALYYSDEEISQICRIAIDFFSQLQGNQTYGGSKSILDMYACGKYPVPNTRSLKVDSHPKVRQYNIDLLKISFFWLSKTASININYNFPILATSLYYYNKSKYRDWERIYFYLIENAKNFYDFVFLVTAIVKGAFNEEKVWKILPYAVKNVQKYRINKSILQGLLFKVYYDYTLKNNFTTDVLEKIKLDIKTMIELSSLKLNDFPKIDLYPQQKKISLRLTQLNSYLFSERAGSSVAETFQKASTYNKILPLQSLEIAINEGTTKDFVSATLTELVQNSVDAIRVTDNEEKNITVNYGHDEDRIMVSVQDYVGIPPNGFLSLSVPFLSTKTASTLTTGEMGSGFFNVYRGSEIVVIESIHNGILRMAIDKPIYTGNRITDIHREYFEQPTSESNITIVYFRSMPIDKNLLVEYVTSAGFTAHKILSQVTIFNVIDYRVNGLRMSVQTDIVSDKEDFQVRVGGSNPSYIFTNGIPFAPLQDYIQNYDPKYFAKTYTGIQINMRGNYSPVQSRTRIIMNEETKEKFQIAINAGMMANILDYLEEKDEFYKIPNFKSRSSPDQLGISLHYAITDDIDFLIMTKFPSFVDFSLGRMMNYMMVIMGDKPFLEVEDKLVEKFSEIKDDSYTYLWRKAYLMVMQWFKIKNTFEEKILKNLEKNDVQDSTFPLDKFNGIMKIWFDVYGRIATKAKITGWDENNLQKVEAVRDFKLSAIGYYEKAGKKIVINTAKYATEDLNLLLSELRRIKSIIDFENITSPIWTKSFKLAVPSTACIHEWEHARRAEDHAHSSHGYNEVSLYPGDAKVKRTYNESANDVYRKIISEGLYTELLKELKKAGYIPK